MLNKDKVTCWSEFIIVIETPQNCPDLEGIPEGIAELQDAR